MTTQSSRDQHTHKEGILALDLKDVSVHYDNQMALEKISLQIEAGLRVAVLGPNGAGKSTLFHVLAGVLPSSSGSVRVYGHKPTKHLCTAYVMQSRQLDWSFPVCVADVVMMGRTGLLGLFHYPTSRDRQVVAQSLERLGISHLEKVQIGELSGGQRQRMFVARALAQEAELILLDEPLAGLDAPSKDRLFAILDELAEDDVTVLVATHDLNLAGEKFDRIMLIDSRLIGYGRRKEVLTAQNLAQAYGGHVQTVETVDGMVMIGDTGGHHAHDEGGPHG